MLNITRNSRITTQMTILSDLPGRIPSTDLHRSAKPQRSVSSAPLRVVFCKIPVALTAAAYQRGKDYESILINFFPRWERLFTIGENSRQPPIFSEVVRLFNVLRNGKKHFFLPQYTQFSELKEVYFVYQLIICLKNPPLHVEKIDLSHVFSNYRSAQQMRVRLV